MKSVKKIVLLCILGLFVLSFSTSDNWIGTWDTSFGTLTIKKENNALVGSFPRGTLNGKIKNGAFEGQYTRNVGKIDKHKLGQKGEFKFTPNTAGDKFEGYFKPEGARTWLTEKWIGTKQLAKMVVQPTTTTIPTVISWTGTWQTDKIGKLKVFVTNKDKIEGKFFIQGSVDFIITGDLVGSNFNTALGTSNQKNFIGRFKTSEGKAGYFYFVLGWGSAKNLNEFSGYLEYDDVYKNGKIVTKSYKETITGKRISSDKPNMAAYN